MPQARARILHHEHVPAPDEWGQTFTDPRLAAAVVDRLTFNAIIVPTGSASYRLRTTQHTKTTRNRAAPA